jgi:hypothetical protein
MRNKFNGDPATQPQGQCGVMILWQRSNGGVTGVCGRSPIERSAERWILQAMV